MVAVTDIRPLEGLGTVKAVDPIWDSMREEARAAAERDPLLAAFLYSTIINHRSLEECVIYRICERLDHPDMQAILLRQESVFGEVLIKKHAMFDTIMGEGSSVRDDWK